MGSDSAGAAAVRDQVEGNGHVGIAGMRTYSIDDLQIHDDPVGHIRRNPAMYLRGVDRAVGEYLAARMLEDLILSGVLPARVNKVQQWWEVSCATDWLVGRGGIGAFTRIVPFPGAGPNSMHSEILLTAFADNVVTSGVDGVRWIRGDSSSVVPSEIAMDRSSDGRIVAFSTKEPSAVG
jgi:hypothetical protein